MRRILLLMAVWCYSWSAMAIDGEWRTEVFEEPRFGDRAWWAAYNGGDIASGQGQLSSELIDVKLELSRRTVKGPFCTNQICALEKKYILTISSVDSLHQEKIAIMTRARKSFSDSELVLDVDIEGEKVVGDVHSVGGITTLRFSHWDRRVLMNIEYGSLERGDMRITLTISRSDGHPFQWLGHEAEMVTLGANLFPVKDTN